MFTENYPRSSWYRDIVLLTILIGFCYALFLGSTPLIIPDEGRYAEIPREMLASGDYVTPRLNHIEYLEKPPLVYWISAATIKTFGMSEWSLRLPSMMMGLLGSLLIYAAGRKLFNRRIGLIASFILSSSLLFFMLAHVLILDTAFCTFLSATLLFFLLSTRTPLPSKKLFTVLAASGCAALAVLTKGLIGIIFPLAICGVWFLFFGDKRSIKLSHMLLGALLFLSITVPWHVLIQAQHPEFFRYYFIEQHFLRYFTANSGRGAPFWFFIPVILFGFFPWSAWLFQTLKEDVKAIKNHDEHAGEILFLLIWTAFIFIFFSLSHSKLVPYVLPTIPPLALLVGQYLSKHLAHAFSKILFGILMFCLCILIASIVLFILLPQYARIDNPQMVFRYLLLFCMIFIAGSCVALCLGYRKKSLMAVVIFSLAASLSFIPIHLAIPAIQSDSIKPIVIKLNPLLQRAPGEIYCYEHYYQDLPVYLKRFVKIVNWHNELRFGEMYEKDASTWLITNQQFFKQWKSRDRAYLIIRKDDLATLKQSQKDLPLFVVTTSRYDALVVNQ